MQLKDIAHKIKGTSGTIGLLQIHHISKELELSIKNTDPVNKSHVSILLQSLKTIQLDLHSIEHETLIFK